MEGRVSTTSNKVVLSYGAFFVALVLFGLFARSAYVSTQKMNKTDLPIHIEAPNVTPKMEVKKNNWEEDIKTDLMTDKKTIKITTKSINTINLEFPYSGEQYAHLMVRKHPRYGKDIILAFSEGQIDMDSDGGNLLARFDDEQPQKIFFLAPADGSRNAVFLNGFDRIYRKILKSKTMNVEITFYSNGVQHLKFDVSNFPQQAFETN
jgi:hypothetical protein